MAGKMKSLKKVMVSSKAAVKTFPLKRKTDSSWKKTNSLLSISSVANDGDTPYYRRRTDLERLKELSDSELIT
ncbi:MAG TPA: hypothetical protein VF817_02780, partial [Patescibacteria group bacterium]